MTHKRKNKINFCLCLWKGCDHISLIEPYIDFSGKGEMLRDKVQVAIERMRKFDPYAPTIGKMKKYKLPFSGGKDSLVVFTLAVMADIQFEAVHAPTIEFAETMQYIRKEFGPWVKQQQPKRFTNRAKPKFRGKPKTMFNLIASRKIPPTRQNPYCCSDLKENVGEAGDFLLLGVRAEESKTRQTRGIVTFWKGKTCINPIVDWTTEDVWEFINHHKLPYNIRYDMGYDRVGCPGCPKSKNQKRELEENPKWKNWYLLAFKHMLENLDDEERRTWKTAEDVYNWWIGECEHERAMEGQCEIGCEFM